jgi:hypothetical protein
VDRTKVITTRINPLEPQQLTVGTVIQLNPETARNQMFAGCFMVVTEPKTWGAQGYVTALGENGQPGGAAFYRAQWGEMELVGQAVWISLPV